LATQAGNPRARVLVLAAHPDDEVLGVGGAMALHVRNGDAVTVALASNGTPRGDGHSDDQHSFAHSALACLGVRDLRLLGFRELHLDTLPLVDVVGPLEGLVADVRPNVVYCQYGGDLNRDHKVLFEAALVALRPTVPDIRAVYAYDTASSTEWAYPRSFVPDTWVDITATLEAKLAAMRCYETELREYPHPRSLEALRHKAAAAGNQCCLASAEVLMTIRRVLRDGQTPV
jgi:LmbE family N-acetylglucosaminyl deacetylase